MNIVERLIMSCLFVFGFIVYSGICFADTITIIDGVIQVEKDGGISNVGTVSGCVQGNGKTKTETRKLPSFDSIDVGGAFDVEIVSQKKQKVEITSDSNILPHIITKVKGDSLVIESKESICPKTLKVNIAIDTIKNISSSGSNEIVVSNVKSKILIIDLDGSSELKSDGQAEELILKIDGSSDVNTKDLKAENVSVTITGAADAVVYASKKLDAAISGAGSIAYYGDPAKVSKDISGAGDIYSAVE